MSDSDISEVLEQMRCDQLERQIRRGKIIRWSIFIGINVVLFLILPLSVFLFICLPIELLGYIVYGFLCIPAAIREKRDRTVAQSIDGPATRAAREKLEAALRGE